MDAIVDKQLDRRFDVCHGCCILAKACFGELASHSAPTDRSGESNSSRLDSSPTSGFPVRESLIVRSSDS